ncbi:MAG: hypothetical protein P8Y60_16090, partial [Calditrichota bacterium]
MKKTLILILTGSILLSEVIISCQRTMYQLANPVIKDEKYDTSYPQRNLSKALQSILGTIYSLNSVAYYSGFAFTGDSKVTLQDIRSNSYKNKAVKKLVYNTSVLGTATVLYSSYRQVVLLTCAHVLSFPDTSIRYFREEGSQNPTDYIRSVAFKLRQH